MDEPEANVEGPELTQGEPKVEPTEPEVDWKAELERTKAELETERANREAAQRNLSDREAKLREAQAQSAALEAMRKRVEELAENHYATVEYLDELAGARANPIDYTLETPQPQRRRLDELKEQRAKRQAEEEQARQQSEDMQLFLKTAADWGIDYNNDAEFQKTMVAYGSPRAALPHVADYAKQRLEALNKAKEEEARRQAEAEKLKEKQKEVEEDGSLDQPTGGTAGASLSFDEEYRKAVDDYLKNSSNPVVEERYLKLRRERELHRR